MFDFIKPTPQSSNLDKLTLLDEISKAAKRQSDAGNISLEELKKIVALLNNTTKLKNALRFL